MDAPRVSMWQFGTAIPVRYIELHDIVREFSIKPIVAPPQVSTNINSGASVHDVREN